MAVWPTNGTGGNNRRIPRVILTVTGSFDQRSLRRTDLPAFISIASLRATSSQWACWGWVEYVEYRGGGGGGGITSRDDYIEQ
mmetsp:Transcript_29009/g.29386  ORF Transcript_29009/g.29386 Transcript_29009/m.29386 type:complete len:83 (+) Transcript_29009:75-323(+)